MAQMPEEKHAYQQEWREKNPSYAREWRKRNPEYRAREAEAQRRRRAARTPAERERDLERSREYGREWRAKNKDKNSAKSREYYAQNGEKIRKRSRESYRRNREAARAYQRVYRLRLCHGLRPEDWVQMLAAQEGCCYLCGRPLGERAVVDHDHSCCPANQSCRACRRGLAHDECNVIAGLAGDDPSRLHQIADALATAKQAAMERIAQMGTQPTLDEGIA